MRRLPARRLKTAGSLSADSRNLNNHWRFQHNSLDVSELAFLNFASARICLLPFSDFASAMTLEMTLAANGGPANDV